MNVRVLTVYMKECKINGIKPNIKELLSLNNLINKKTLKEC